MFVGFIFKILPVMSPPPPSVSLKVFSEIKAKIEDTDVASVGIYESQANEALLIAQKTSSEFENIIKEGSLGETLGQEATLGKLLELKEHSESTFWHSLFVMYESSRFCGVLLSRHREAALGEISAKRLNLLCLSLLTGALLHDVGKILVPREVLHKNGGLNEKEFEEMKGHTVLGLDKLVAPDQRKKFKNATKDNPGDYVLKKLFDGVLYHHENWNGSGYPHEIADDEIPLLAAIIRLMDSVEAALQVNPLSRRPYDADRSGTNPKKTLLEIDSRFGTWYSPVLQIPFREYCDTFFKEYISLEDFSKI